MESNKRVDVVKVDSGWLVTLTKDGVTKQSTRPASMTMAQMVAAFKEAGWIEVRQYSETRLRAWSAVVEPVRSTSEVKAMRSRFSRAFSQGQKPAGFEDVANPQQYDLMFDL